MADRKRKKYKNTKDNIHISNKSQFIKPNTHKYTKKLEKNTH